LTTGRPYPGDLHIVGTERRCLVDQPGAVLGGDIVGQDHDMRALDGDVVEWRLIVPAGEVASGVAAEHLRVIAEDSG
jgi:hypothetical protein